MGGIHKIQTAKIDPKTGLTTEEKEVMDHLVDAVNKYALLPAQHPCELEDFLNTTHRLQDILAIRVARRAFPEGWYMREKTRL